MYSARDTSKRWVFPFGHRGIKALLPAPPRFSQAYTSFFAYHRQGIHLMHDNSHCLYASGFRFYFTPLPGFFSPFPHGTGSLSVDDEYLALEDGPPIFRQDFTCPALLVVCLVPLMRFRIRGYHPLWQKFPILSSISSVITYRLLRVRSPLLTESRLISFPPGT